MKRICSTTINTLKVIGLINAHYPDCASNEDGIMVVDTVPSSPSVTYIDTKERSFADINLTLDENGKALSKDLMEIFRTTNLVQITNLLVWKNSNKDSDVMISLVGEFYETKI